MPIEIYIRHLARELMVPQLVCILFLIVIVLFIFWSTYCLCLKNTRYSLRVVFFLDTVGTVYLAEHLKRCVLLS